MSRIMEKSKNKVVFAVGLAHWDIGDKSLISLLGGRNYTVERMTSDVYLQEIEKLSDQDCADEIRYDAVADKIVYDSRSERIGTITIYITTLIGTVLIFNFI